MDRHPGLRGEPLLDPPVPVAYAEGSVAVRAQQAVAVERRQRAGGVARCGGVVHGEGVGQHGRADRAGRVAVGHPLDRVAAGTQRRDRAVGVAEPQRLGELPDLGAVAVRGGERSDRGVRPVLVATDQVGQHGAGVDRAELVGVADEHQPRLGPHRLEQAGHHRQRHHRRLVDHDQVVGEAVAAVVAEARAVAGVLAQHPVHRHRGHVGQAGLVGRAEAARGVAHGLLESRGRLAGGGGEGDPQRLAAGLRLLPQRDEQSRDRGGLAGAGAAGDDRRGLGGRPVARRPLLGRLGSREDPGQGASGAAPRRRPAPTGRARAGRRGPGSPARGSGRGRPGRARGAPPRQPPAGSP